MHGVSYLHDGRAQTWDTGARYVDGGGFNQYGAKPVFSGRQNKFDFEVQASSLTADDTLGSDVDDFAEYVALNTTVCSINGTDYLARTESASIKITNTTKDLKGVGSVDSLPTSVRQNVTIEIQLYADSADTNHPGMSGIGSQTTVATIQGSSSPMYQSWALTCGAFVLSSTGGAVSIKRAVQHEGAIMLPITIVNRGAITLSTPTDSILADALANPPTCAYSFNDSINTVSGTGLIESLSFSIPQEGICTMSGSLLALATPTVV